MAISDKLKYARSKSGLTIEEVSRRTTLGSSTISDFENEKRPPSVCQLQKLAGVYHRSIEFFLSDTEIQEEIVRWRKHPEVDAQIIESQFLKLCEQYHNLEMWTNNVLPCSLLQQKGNPEHYTFAKIEALAKDFRDYLSLGDYPAFGLFSKLEENCGIKIFFMDFEPSGTAASTLNSSFGTAILLNKKNVRWRRNFDLAHELFHLLTWEVFEKSGVLTATCSAKEEQLADHFAGALLMPQDSIMQVIGNMIDSTKMKVENYFDIARQFDVSTDALIWRLHNLKLLNGQEPKKIISDIQPLKRIYEDRLPDTQLLPWPMRYYMLAVNALRQGLISIGKCADYLGISRHEAMEFVKQEAYGDQEISPAFA